MRVWVARGIVTQLCVWGEQSAVSVFRVRFNRVVRSVQLRTAIYKIERVMQPDGRIRFDLFVRSAVANQLLSQITVGSQTLRYCWYCRPHIPYRDRLGQTAINMPPQRMHTHTHVPEGTTAAPSGTTPVNTPPTTPPRSGSLRVASYNINGVTRKRTELRLFLEETRCDILGLQETLLRATDWHLRIPQYTCYTAMGDLTAATRGVALVVSKRFSSIPVGRASPYWVFARVYGHTLAQPTLVGSVYVPHQRRRRHVMSSLPLAITRLKEEFPDDPLILLGDFNADTPDVQRDMATWPYPCQVVANVGNTPTRRRGRLPIDHVAYWGTPTTGRVLPAQVLRTWDLSDHYPVMVRFPGLVDRHRQETRPTPPSSTPKILVHRPETRPLIANTNYWAPLADEFGIAEDEDEDEDEGEGGDSPETRLEHLSQRWVSTCHQVATDLHLHAKGPPKPSTVSKSISRAVRRRRKCHCTLETALRQGDPHTIRESQIAYTEAARTAIKAIRRARGKAWYRQIYKAQAQMLHRPREFWQWSAQYGRWRTKGAPAGLQPVYSREGTLLTSLPDIVQRWASHYEELGRDITGHSRDEAYWHFLDPEPRTAHMGDLDAEFTRHDVWAALTRMKRHKAPGKDGIPADFLQACLQEEDKRTDELQVPPQTPMTDALRTLLNCAFRHGTIPSNWEESIVLSLPKDGDLADPGNYRGISLMSTTLKIITVILAARISEAGEARNLFSPAQAGFRRLEEAVTQAACVIDILQRRRIARLRTYAIFIDLKKAYDTVPHGALFAKLSRFGVRGRCLAFVKGLYARSRISVRVGLGTEAQYSDPFPLRRGLRQGCPLSPVLFNIFINDLLDGMEGVSGVGVPSGPRADWSRPHITVAGALFADDAVGLTGDIAGAIRFCERITAWTKENEMEVGISKCGILELAPSNEEEAQLTEDHPLRHQLCISRQPVPLVSEYKYLGITLTKELDVPSMVRSRLRLGRLSILHLQPFLSSSVLPVSMRYTVVRAVILPRLLYGAEVYGMNRALTDSMQTLVNTALKAITGIRARRSAVPSAALWQEFRLAPICALAAGRRARAYRKCFELRTTIGTIIANPLRSRGWTWSSGTSRWIERYCAKYFDEVRRNQRTRSPWQELSPHQLRDLVQACITLRERKIRSDPTRATGPATNDYFQLGFHNNPLTVARVFCHPRDHAGIAAVIRCRLGVFPLAPRLVEWRRLPDRYSTECPFCGRDQPETMLHLLVECRAWRRVRRATGLDGTLGSIDLLRRQYERWRDSRHPGDDDAEHRDTEPWDLSSSDLALSWILGGVHGKWGMKDFMPRPPAPALADEGASISASSSSSQSMEGAALGTYSDQGQDRAHLLRVGMFLTRIQCLRTRLLCSLLLPVTWHPRQRLDPAAPATTTGQSPDG